MSVEQKRRPACEASIVKQSACEASDFNDNSCGCRKVHKGSPRPPPGYTGPNQYTIDWWECADKSACPGSSGNNYSEWYAASRQRYTEGDKRYAKTKLNK